MARWRSCQKVQALSALVSLLLLLSSFYWHKYLSPTCPGKLTFNPHECPDPVPSTVTKTPVSAVCGGKMSRQWCGKRQCEVFLGSYYQSKVFRNFQSGGLDWSWFRADSHLCTTLNCFAQGLYTGWGVKLQLQHPDARPFFPCASSCQGCPIVPQWPWLNCPSVAQVQTGCFSLHWKSGQVWHFLSKQLFSASTFFAHCW